MGTGKPYRPCARIYHTAPLAHADGMHAQCALLSTNRMRIDHPWLSRPFRPSHYNILADSWQLIQVLVLLIAVCNGDLATPLLHAQPSHACTCIMRLARSSDVQRLIDAGLADCCLGTRLCWVRPAGSQPCHQQTGVSQKKTAQATSWTQVCLSAFLRTCHCWLAIAAIAVLVHLPSLFRIIKPCKPRQTVHDTPNHAKPRIPCCVWSGRLLSMIFWKLFASSACKMSPFKFGSLIKFYFALSKHKRLDGISVHAVHHNLSWIPSWSQKDEPLTYGCKCSDQSNVDAPSPRVEPEQSVIESEVSQDAPWVWRPALRPKRTYVAKLCWSKAISAQYASIFHSDLLSVCYEM